MKYILSIDFSVQQSGYAILCEDEMGIVSLIKFGTLTEDFINEYSLDLTTYDKIEFELTSSNRLLRQLQLIDYYLKVFCVFDNNDTIQIAIEDCYFKTNAQVFKDAVLFQGMMVLYCEERKIPLLIQHATSWRKGIILAKKRELQKQEAIEYVNNRFGLNFEYNKNKLKSHDDIAEAIVMGVSALRKDKL